MKFTQDWFSENIPTFKHAMGLLPQRKQFLEIGSFEGRATVWMLENGLDADGEITCIDTFKGGEEHSDLELDSLFDRFVENVLSILDREQGFHIIQETSYSGLAKCIREDKKFDFIYIDGSHQASDVLTDACMAFGMLNKGGIMLFDDYLWDHVPGILHQPKIAVDSFVNIFNGQCRVVIMGYQQGIVKL